MYKDDKVIRRKLLSEYKLRNQLTIEALTRIVSNKIETIADNVAKR